MRWLAKAALQRGVSALPAAEGVNYVFQRHVTGSLPTSESRFRKKFARAVQHFDAYLEHGPRRSAAEAVFYEFGAGWDLEIPLVYWCLGIDRQIVIDVRANVRLELVNHSLGRLGRSRAKLEAKAGRTLRDPGRADVGSVRELADRFGISYLAPRDARATGLDPGSVDFVSSTSTLEHVPAEDLVPILSECRRLLRPDGAMSSRIDLRDHFSYFDRRLTPYNFLRFGERSWRLVNSSLNYQNRLRRPNYLEAFAAAGLTIVAEAAILPGEDDLAALREIDPAPEFRRYSLEDLAVKGLRLVARPARTDSPDAAQELEDLRGRGRAGVRAGAGALRGRLGHFG